MELRKLCNVDRAIFKVQQEKALTELWQLRGKKRYMTGQISPAKHISLGFHISILPVFCEVLEMKLVTVKSEGLAHNSYFLVDGEEAVVVDPRRDCRIYTKLARKFCSQIRYILETHRNEDYVVGSLELQGLTKSEILHGKHLAFKYGSGIEDDETLKVGNLEIQALHTPGHTNESMCYKVTDTEKSEKPMLVFTGDTLFVGSVGRTDLQGKDAQHQQAEKLYMSLHEKLLHLGDGVLVYPAHGAGSVCGSGISGQPFTTVGYEKQTNWYLSIGKEEFVEASVAQEMIVPSYFAKTEELNLNGAPKLLGLPFPKSLDVAEFEAEAAEEDSVVVDTREPYAFAGSHIPNALSLWFGDGTAVYSGWILGYDQRVLLVTEQKSDVAKVTRHLWRCGFDNVLGYLCSGMNEWQKQGKPLAHTHTISVADLRSRLERYVVLDVREPGEWHTEGTIEGAETVFFADLPQKADDLERNRRYAITCSVGNRASIAASILQRKGFGHVTNVLGGMTAWQSLGYPTVKPQKSKDVPVVLQ